MCYFHAFVNVFFALNSFEDVESKAFIVPLSVERELSIPTTFVVLPRRLGLCAVVPPEAHSGQTASREKAPEVELRCTRRRGTATSRLRSCCSPKAPRWTPRTSTARASTREAGARHRVSPTWGASKKCLDQTITSSMLMNDHNARCHI